MGIFRKKETEGRLRGDPDEEMMQALHDIVVELQGRSRAQGHPAGPEDAKADDYGISPGNPVYVTSIPAGCSYLSRLRDSSGQPVAYWRIGSFQGPGGLLSDGYMTVAGRRQCRTVYICPYGREDAKTAPAGFTM